MNTLYNISIGTYKRAVKLAATGHRKARLMTRGQADTFDYLERTLGGEGCIWVHASSLGEFEQGRPLIEKIRRERPESKILLSFFSPSGYEVRKNYDQVDAVCYLPFDTPSLVRHFLDLAKPSMAIFIKYEFWGNYLQELKRRSVPTYIVSAIFRPGQIFFRPWGGMFRKMLGCFTRLYVQNEESRVLLHSIGVDNVTVAGDTRFDRVSQVKASTRRFPEIEAFAASAEAVIVGGSTWEPDEDLLLPYFNSHPNVKLILAPHEFDEHRLQALLARCQRPAMLYSQLKAGADAASCDCVVVDCFGLLSSLYRYGTLAMVGGGFGVSIHNINEAAVYGIPVLFGPRHEKFPEAAAMIDCGGGFEVTDSDRFTAVADRLLSDPERLATAGAAAAHYIESNIGATEKIYNDLFA